MAGPLSGSAGPLYGKVAEGVTLGGEGGVAPDGKGAGILHGWTGI